MEMLLERGFRMWACMSAETEAGELRRESGESERLQKGWISSC